MSARPAGREQEGRAAGWCGYHGDQGSYITDLVLGLLDSLEFGCVCHHAEAFALVLLKLFLIAHLENQGGDRLESSQGEQRGPRLCPPLRQQPARREILTRNPPVVISTPTPKLKVEDLTKKCSTNNDNLLTRIQCILSSKCFTPTISFHSHHILLLPPFCR